MYNEFILTGTIFFIAGTLHVAIGIFFGVKGLVDQRRFKKAQAADRARQEQAMMEMMEKEATIDRTADIEAHEKNVKLKKTTKKGKK